MGGGGMFFQKQLLMGEDFFGALHGVTNDQKLSREGRDSQIHFPVILTLKI